MRLATALVGVSWLAFFWSGLGFLYFRHEFEMNAGLAGDRYFVECRYLHALGIEGPMTGFENAGLRGSYFCPRWRQVQGHWHLYLR